MAFGLDYISGPPIADLKSAEVAFVCRYLSFVNEETRVKLLSASEAKTLSGENIALVSNYEWYANRALEGATSGIQDAQIAASQHADCGGPPDRPIYFSVDFDALKAQLPTIGTYFKGISSVMGLPRTAAYGPYQVIKYLLDNHLITYAWQTYAWSDGQWDLRAHIQQYQNGMTIAGCSVDYNRSMMPDFGQWFIGGNMIIPQGWHDDGTTLTAPNGHKVVLGNRKYVLSYPGGWNANNQPLEEEWHADPLEVSNPSLGPGQKQGFNETTLEYTPARGVFEAWQGQEIVALRAEIAKLQAAQPAPIDTTALVAAINAIPDAIAGPVAAALVEAKKL